jgi:hypothetical protein
VATLTFSQEIDRPVADGFATVADIGTFASRNPTIKSSRQLTSGEPGMACVPNGSSRASVPSLRNFNGSSRTDACTSSH